MAPQQRHRYSITSSAVASNCGWNFKPERLGGPEVDHKLELVGLYDRQIGRLLALENPSGVDAGLTIGIG